jgi:hypothetical protein
MKKILVLITLTLGSVMSYAQEGPNLENNFSAFHNQSFVFDFLHIVAVVFLLSLLVFLILSILRYVLDQRVKNKLIEKGASETIISKLMPAVEEDNKIRAFKWGCILVGLGVGLTLISLFPPLGIHSLAMMSFSLAGSFLAYYFFTRKTNG